MEFAPPALRDLFYKLPILVFESVKSQDLSSPITLVLNNGAV